MSAKEKNMKRAGGNPLKALWNLLVVGAGLVAGLQGLSWLLKRFSRGDIAYASALQGEAQQVLTRKDFRGGVVSVVAGQTELDLRDAGLDERPVLLVSVCIAGQMIIRVPEHWKVKSYSFMVAGEFANQLPKKAESDPVDVELYTFTIAGQTLIKAN